MSKLKLFLLFSFLIPVLQLRAQTIEVRTDFHYSGWVFLLPDSSDASDLGLDAQVKIDTNGVGSFTVKNLNTTVIKCYQHQEDLSEFIKLPAVVVSEEKKDSTARYFVFYIPTEKERELPSSYWDKIFTREKLYKRRVKKEILLRKLGYSL